MGDPARPQVGETQSAHAGQEIARGDRGPDGLGDARLKGERVQDQVDQRGREGNRQRVVEHHDAPHPSRFVQSQLVRQAQPRKGPGGGKRAQQHHQQCLPGGDQKQKGFGSREGAGLSQGVLHIAYRVLRIPFRALLHGHSGAPHSGHWNSIKSSQSRVVRLGARPGHARRLVASGMKTTGWSPPTGTGRSAM